MKRFFLFFLLLAAAWNGLGQTSYTNAYEAIGLFTTVLEEVHRSYVDADEAGYDALIRHALSGMLQELDPYSQFLDEEGFDDIQEETSGHFGGVGLVVSMKQGRLTVISPMEDTPAFRAGILSGDLIIEIDGEETHSMSLSEAVKMMRGKPGTEVTLKTLRPSTHRTDEHVIVRDDIEVASVKDTKMLEDGIGYIRITQFAEPTADSLKEALRELSEPDRDLRALVMDLRGNPGGLLSAAGGVAELFLPRGELIVFTKDRNGEPLQEFKATGSVHYRDMPLAILVNRGSASASEIVAGALQDHNRAILVGEKTFGKGSVQSLLPLEDGSAVKLTTAKYYTPSEREIHDKGIEPDIRVDMDPETLYRLRLSNMQQQDGAEADEPADDSLGEGLSDVQLEKAIGVLQGVLIFREKQ